MLPKRKGTKCMNFMNVHFQSQGKSYFFYTIRKVIQRLCYSCCTWHLFNNNKPALTHSCIHFVSRWQPCRVQAHHQKWSHTHSSVQLSNYLDIKMAVLVCRNRITKEPLCLYHCIFVYMQILWWVVMVWSDQREGCLPFIHYNGAKYGAALVVNKENKNSTPMSLSKKLSCGIAAHSYK